jgi:putative ABC transport system substrate-binding protein
MRRRDFIALLGGVVTWPIATRAQQPAKPVIGFLNPTSPEGYAPLLVTFRQGLREAGYVEGENVSIEYRWAEAQYDRLPTMAADLVRRQVTMIAATGGTYVGAVAKRATSTIPIVFAGTGDPVSVGLVASLNRPGGNVTGVYMLAVELLPKRVELVSELIPNANAIGVLVNPTNPSTKVQLPMVQEAARSLGRHFVILNATSEGDLDTAFASLGQLQVGALLISSDTFLVSQANHLASLTVRHAMPAISERREFAVAGGLMSYGTSFTDAYRHAGIYIGRILKGEKPADLPVQQSTKVELVVNLKTAKALGLTIPPTLLSRADELIE